MKQEDIMFYEMAWKMNTRPQMMMNPPQKIQSLKNKISQKAQLNIKPTQTLAKLNFELNLGLSFCKIYEKEPATPPPPQPRHW